MVVILVRLRLCSRLCWDMFSFLFVGVSVKFMVLLCVVLFGDLVIDYFCWWMFLLRR